ncbi:MULTISPECIES: YbfB/YjiJ family MFS transporter [Paraburkholderia]|jgi:predicted MFS family arabinose efflux permease|uniref:MFS family arabinose efflux permease n=1 Tax=Paraburkholderia graminis TaxID=60548 RepID=A0ABD5CJ27_9BURK|nr:YbfB/YjiJ family MFS transporter [Paraburkholderia graminis]MDQ0626780.1 putative MFS family arabinose efflux permease [Paraburkholderia graminis]MDR6205093.1 putative MFS family arabinose efflux permease [Paraburkholderia graminis]
MSTAPSLSSSSSTSLDARALFATFAGLSGSLVAIGLARFAYTPLIPSLIQAHWFTSSQAVTLGAANFAGYLIGALIGRPLASALSNRTALRMLMAVVTAAFFACAYPLSISWFFVWRLLSGISGGAIMVLVATSILPHIPAARRGFVSGMIFLGLGLGIAASGTLIPELLHFGLQTTWLGLGAVALVLTVVSWFGWPSTNPPAAAAAPAHHHGAQTSTLALRVLYAQYAANALGLVPAMILLVDYVARGLGRGAAIGANYWVLYGLAAIAGPLIAGNVAHRIGYGKAYRVALLLQAVAVAMIALSGNAWVLTLSTVILGVFTPGIVPLALGRIHELVPHDHTEQRASWSRATTAFALFQALGGYGYSYLFSHSHNNYALIFMCGAAALGVAFIADLIVSRIRTAGSLAA